MTQWLVRINARGAADGAGAAFSPGSLVLGFAQAPASAGGMLVGRAQCLGVGTPTDVDALLRTRLDGRTVDQTIDRPHAVLIPGLVNAHTHLDLTHIGPRPFDAREGFASFIKVVLAHRLADPDAIARSVALGVRLCLRGGVVAVGDIGGVAGGKPTLAPFHALAGSPLFGVSFLEFFAIGTGEAANVRELEQVLRATPGSPPKVHDVRLGLSPHAPYTVGPRAFEAAIGLARSRNLLISTHVAETPEERQFLAEARGPFRDFLERIGLWGGDCETWAGRGRTPVAHMEPMLRQSRMLLAHVNDCDDAALATLAQSGASVAYCPRSSDYFKNHEHFGPHRYRDMLARGVPVALGTDSVINLPADAREPTLPMGARLSTLDEARFLFARDGGDPMQFLAMATTHGARALGLDPAAFAWTVGAPCAGVVAVHVPESASPAPARAVLEGQSSPELLVLGRTPDLAGSGALA